MDTHCGMKHTLCGFSLGFAFGVVEALYMLLFAWGARLYGYDTSFIQQIGQVFYGYAPTMVGGLYGVL
jgi:ABC-type nitrate/sulfonate/bicarbonate transport system permease component